MKKVTTLLTLMAGVGLAFGQAQIGYNSGTVSFQNTETVKQGLPAAQGHLVTNITTGQLLVGTQYKAELYYLDTTSSSLVALPASISSFKSTTASSGLGTWGGLSATVPVPAGYGGIDLVDDGAGGLAEAGDGSGTGAGYYPVTFVVRAWDSTGGANTYETAVFRSQSAQFTYTQRYTSPPATADTQMLRQPGFGIVTPEPSAIALSIMGVAGLLFIRRRKS